jgi:hypothetical protein
VRDQIFACQIRDNESGPAFTGVQAGLLTGDELRRFVEKNILTIDRKDGQTSQKADERAGAYGVRLAIDQVAAQMSSRFLAS